MKHAWLNTIEYPFESYYFNINGSNLHYIDEGEGEVIIFVHGTPSWSFDFRHLIKDLSQYYRCIAIDHIGFGLSDKPSDYSYKTQRHSDNLEQLIRSLNIQNCHLVVHDFGGPIGINVAIQNPTWFKSITILNSWLWSSENQPEYKKLKRILKSPILPFLYKYFNFSARYILPSSFGEKKLSKALLKQYTQPFEAISERYGPIAFAKSLLNDQQWFESLWQQRDKIQSKPIAIIWGMKDPVILPYNLYKFQTGFPKAITFKLETAGHFPQEEQPETVSQYLREFLQTLNTQS